MKVNNQSGLNLTGCSSPGHILKSWGFWKTEHADTGSSTADPAFSCRANDLQSTSYLLPGCPRRTGGGPWGRGPRCSNKQSPPWFGPQFLFGIQVLESHSHAKLECHSSLCGTQGLPFSTGDSGVARILHSPLSRGTIAVRYRVSGVTLFRSGSWSGAPAIQPCASCQPLCLSFLLCNMGQY